MHLLARSKLPVPKLTLKPRELHTSRLKQPVARHCCSQSLVPQDFTRARSRLTRSAVALDLYQMQTALSSRWSPAPERDRFGDEVRASVILGFALESHWCDCIRLRMFALQRRRRSTLHCEPLVSYCIVHATCHLRGKAPIATPFAAQLVVLYSLSSVLVDIHHPTSGVGDTLRSQPCDVKCDVAL